MYDLDCGKPPEIENGNLVLNVANKTTYGSVANIECNVDFVPSGQSISCKYSGEWEEALCTKEGKIFNMHRLLVTYALKQLF